VMEYLNALETPAEKFDSELGTESRDIAALVQTWCPDVAEYLDSRRHRVQGSPLRRSIDQLWRALVDIFSLDEVPTHPRFKYLAHLASELRGQTVVTLNYDDALEHMKGWAMTFRIISAPYPEPAVLGDPLTRPLRLIKLHGSLDWSRDNATGDVSSLPPTVSFRRSVADLGGHDQCSSAPTREVRRRGYSDDPLRNAQSVIRSAHGWPAGRTDGLLLKMSLAYATGQSCCCRPHSGQLWQPRHR
jgi:hypothetical protein